jgi:hypothetical protein
MPQLQCTITTDCDDNTIISWIGAATIGVSGLSGTSVAFTSHIVGDWRDIPSYTTTLSDIASFIPFTFDSVSGAADALVGSAWTHIDSFVAHINNTPVHNNTVIVTPQDCIVFGYSSVVSPSETLPTGLHVRVCAPELVAAELAYINSIIVRLDISQPSSIHSIFSPNIIPPLEILG